MKHSAERKEGSKLSKKQQVTRLDQRWKKSCLDICMHVFCTQLFGHAMDLSIGRKHARLMNDDGIDTQLSRNSLLYFAWTVRYSFIHFRRLRVSSSNVELCASLALVRSQETFYQCNDTRNNLFAVHQVVKRCICSKMCQLTSSIMEKKERQRERINQLTIILSISLHVHMCVFV